MKFKNNHMLSFLLAIGVLFSCGPREEEPRPSALEVSPKEVALDPQGGQEFLTVTSSEDWLIRTDAKWIKVETSSGKASADPVRASFAFEANQTGASREAVITVKTIKGASVEVKVSQARLEGGLAVRGIADAEDLVAFAQAVNEGGSLTPFMVDGNIVLLNDIDASSIKEWVPAGTKTSPFTGNFDGKGHAIKNISWAIDLAESPYAG